MRPFGTPIVMACDGRYAMPLATALRTLADSHYGARGLEVHVICEEFPEDLRRRVERSLPTGVVHLRWSRLNLAAFNGFSTPRHVSRMTYARLLAPSLFPEGVPTLLYLDTDILVLSNLRELWGTPLAGECCVGAVTDPLDALIKANDAKAAGLPRVRHYFNAGVMLIDVNKWREQRVAERALEYLTLYPCSPLADQDALNYACDGAWMQLAPKWNFQTHYNTTITNLDNGSRPNIVHFVTSAKPWEPSSCSTNAALYDSFREHTEFARTWRMKWADGWVRQFSRCRNVVRRGGLA